MRIRRGPLMGALAGLLVSLAVWAATPRAAPAGFDAGGEHLLFLVSLPWSLLVWAAGVAAVALRGQDGVPVPLFHLMPVAAGAGWGWLVGALRRRRARRNAARAGA